MAIKKKTEETISISEIHMQEADFHVVGRSPMLMNRSAQKARYELLFPSERRNRADLEQSLKHDPIAEFRGAIYRNRDESSRALVHIPNGAFHGAIAKAALDIPGATKSKIERLTKVVNVNIELFGIPHVFCAMVRNSDMARTPDVRTRPIFPEWACVVTVRWMEKVLSEKTVSNLFGAAGQIIGIGDWRSEKGGPYGQFSIVGKDDAEFKRIVKMQGRQAQQHAIDNPIYYDQDTEELLAWFEQEAIKRDIHVPSLPSTANLRRKVIRENGRGEYAESAV